MRGGKGANTWLSGQHRGDEPEIRVALEAHRIASIPNETKTERAMNLNRGWNGLTRTVPHLTMTSAAAKPADAHHILRRRLSNAEEESPRHRCGSLTSGGLLNAAGDTKPSGIDQLKRDSKSIWIRDASARVTTEFVVPLKVETSGWKPLHRLRTIVRNSSKIRSVECKSSRTHGPAFGDFGHGEA